MTTQELQEHLAKIRNIDLKEFGYKYVETTEDRIGIKIAKWSVAFENPFLKSKLTFRLLVPPEGEDAAKETQQTVSLDSFLRSNKPQQYSMDLWRYSKEHNQPLADFTSIKEGQTVGVFIDAYIAAFLEAAKSDLRDFLLGKAWEHQKDYRDMV